MFEFKILKKSKKNFARFGVISTSHGEILTPAFFPVATQGTVKGIVNKELNEIGIQGIFINTFHLYLRPGSEIIKKMGKIHKFINWEKPIFSDSGGFQIFSLGKGMEQGVGKIASIFPEKQLNFLKKSKKKFIKVREEGVEFRSPIDGTLHFMTPEKSIQIQQDLGADIIFTFDECTSPLDTHEYTRKATQRTHSWALRCLKVFKRKKQALYGIVQGGAFKDLRERSAKFINSLDFSGFGIGGSLGKSKKDMFKILKWIHPFLDERRPKHLLGIGSIEDIKKCVQLGVDTFDCVLPTRFARHGVALTTKGKIFLKKKIYLKKKEPLDKDCKCYTCKNFRLSYLAHLVRAGEISAISLIVYHNLFFIEKLFEKIRERIKNGEL